jgi:isopenicillin-N epimerase
LVTSHGANDPRAKESLFRLEFDWTGTADPTAYLSVPAAIDFIGGLLDGGWPEVMTRNHALVIEGRDKLLAAVGGSPLAPDSMLGSLAAIDLPLNVEPSPRPIPADADPHDTYPGDPLRDALSAEDNVEVPVFTWPHTAADAAPRHRLLRISAQLYNSPADYDRLAQVLVARQVQR